MLLPSDIGKHINNPYPKDSHNTPNQSKNDDDDVAPPTYGFTHNINKHQHDDQDNLKVTVTVENNPILDQLSSHNGTNSPRDSVPPSDEVVLSNIPRRKRKKHSTNATL